VGIPIWPSTFGDSEVAIVFWEDAETGAVTFTAGQARVASLGAAVLRGGDGAMAAFDAVSDVGEPRKFLFFNVNGTVQLTRLREEKQEEPLRTASGIYIAKQ
jgi:hypothetical protein